MARLVYYVAASIDGFIARRDGSMDWLPPIDPESEDYGYSTFIESIGTVIMGRRTFEDAIRLSNGVWPYHGKRAIVFSRSLARDPQAAAAVIASLVKRGGPDGPASRYDVSGGAAEGADNSAVDVTFTDGDPGELVRGLKAAATTPTATALAVAGDVSDSGAPVVVIPAVNAPPEDGGGGDGSGDGATSASTAGAAAKDLWLVGGGGLARQLLSCGALDRLVVSVIPVVLGDGLPLFGGVGVSSVGVGVSIGFGASVGVGGEAPAGTGRAPVGEEEGLEGHSLAGVQQLGGGVRLRLEGSRAFPDGVVQNVYAVVAGLD
ncbi:hypothetical protein GPECTOR_35g955 [Gonium pectorale]|uniref:Bacterial bifunctional deaminase-reductase C-terminal domain-containing protein n=1 Tax=Gonium pectorale TaxID=33097 RepID=A0A150GCE2_GONPE|nr:hypothetical protein GPECTOR_35g955 [Gonium pectorale]|eukprot:KXZ47517.1 hypothetical protein GPECTOR_35g955 [Gonium pectorale]